MLTGRPPFKASTVLDTLELVRTQEPVSPRQLQPKTPRDLETICLKCLQKEPGRRYLTAEALASDLQLFGKGEPIQARPVGAMERAWRWCRRNPRVAVPSVAAVVLVLGIAGVSSWFAVALAKKNTVIEQKHQAAVTAEGVAVQKTEDALKAQAEAEQNAKLAMEQSTLALRTIQSLLNEVQTRLAEAPGTLDARQAIAKVAADHLTQVANKIDRSTSKEATQLAAHQLMGSLFQQLGDAQKAKEQFAKGLSVARELVHNSDSSRHNLAQMLRDMGQISMSADRDMAASLNYYQEAIKVSKGHS